MHGLFAARSIQSYLAELTALDPADVGLPK